ncbi:smoothelin isoform 2-T2 [Anomaloglossus baeobatrachus]|uniref:smoothelin isoform X2 n=1 Tax=Anomaloglossus baeobatrachus TaxID=238106 RepID=UPI003F4F7F9E
MASGWSGRLEGHSTDVDMSDERFSAMDEGSLRKLLEVTLDLAERREIRSAIRELRRKELERCEEALASKRFRSEKSNGQEDKENQPGTEMEEKQQRALHALAGRLEAINDLEELTALLRSASEYEERKLIRAAIRKIRNDEIEAAALAGIPVSRYTEQGIGTVQSKSMDSFGETAPSLAEEKEDLEERKLIKAQIHELRTSQNGSSQTRLNEPVSDISLLLRGSSRETLSSSSSTSSSEPGTMAQSCTTEHSTLSTDTEEDPPQSGSSEVFIESVIQNNHTEQKTLPGAKSVFREPNAVVKPESSWTDKNQQNITDKLKVDKNGLCPEEKPSRTFTEPDGQVPVFPFRRANSVRDRMKKFTEEPPGTQPSLGFRFSSMRGERTPSRGARILQQQSLFTSAQKNGQENNHKGTWEERGPVKFGPGRTAAGLGHHTGDQSGSSRTQDSKIVSVPEIKGFHSSSSKESSAHNSAGLGTSSGEVNRKLPPSSFIPKQEGGRSNSHQLQRTQARTEGGKQAENTNGTITTSVDQECVQPSTPSLNTSSKDSQGEKQDTDMKTLLTIEIKDGRNQGSTNSRIVGQPGNQRAELTLGLTASPFRVGNNVSTSSINAGSAVSASAISTGSASAGKAVSTSNIIVDSGFTANTALSKVDPEPSQQGNQQVEVFLPSTIENVKVEIEKKGKVTAEELRTIEDEDVLDKMLDGTTDFEERRLIRTAMRELRQRKREQREKEREQRLQELKNKEKESRMARSTETSLRQTETTNHGSAVSTITKTQRLVQSNDGSKTSRTTTLEASYVKRSENGGTVVQTKSSFSASTSKKVGSVFDREDDGVAALERRQAEKKKELMKAQSLPKTPANQSRKAMIEKLEKDSGSPSTPAFAKVATPRTAAFGVPNANSIKQMLLDWCKAKTRGYDHVDINNFSSSWSDGMAFCALVHNFFPEAFDYNQLSPQNRRQNFDLAFSAAEKHADCPQLLDAEDMVRMREPDWKCVYTYIQEFYRCLVQKGMVKTKKS